MIIKTLEIYIIQHIKLAIGTYIEEQVEHPSKHATDTDLKLFGPCLKFFVTWWKGNL